MQHVFDFLPATQKPEASVCVLFGDEPFLRQLAREHLLRLLLGDRQEDIPCSTFEGEECQLRDVLEELATVSLFGGGGAKRVVLVREADKFISQHRAALEDYVAKPKRTGTLILEAAAWPGNTKLYKAVEEKGFAVECRPPELARGRSKVPDEARIKQWLVERARRFHQIVPDARACQQLVELAGPVFGLLDQNLARLALYVPAGGKVTAELVNEIIGGWRARTAWDMIDAAVNGETAEALLQLDRILQAGDHPVAVFGQIAWSLRRYGAAIRIHEAAERTGKRTTIRESLLAAGFNDWPAGALQKAEDRIKQLGRERAGKMYRWLFELDLALKGSHSQADRARFAIEHLFLKMTSRERMPVREKQPA